MSESVTAQAWIAVVFMDTSRRVWLPKRAVPSSIIPPGLDFHDAVTGLLPIGPAYTVRLLGAYSDPSEYLRNSSHQFVFGFVVTADRKLPQDFQNDLHDENSLPGGVSPDGLRILYDAFSFNGLPRCR